MASSAVDTVVYPASFKPTSREAKSRNIIAAARKVFLADGFDAASMDEIALAAGVSKRTIYNRYASKEDLFSAVATDAVGQIFGIEVSPCFKTPVRKFLHQIAYGVLYQRLNPEALALIRTVAFQVPRMPVLGEVFMEKAVLPFMQRLGEYLEQQAALGHLRPLDGEEAAWIFRTVVSEPLETRMIMGGEKLDDLEAAISEQAELGIERFFRIYGIEDHSTKL